MRWVRLTGAVVLCLGMMLTGCNQQTSSELPGSSSGSVSAETESQGMEHQVDEETVRSFLEEHLPSAYLTSTSYLLGLEQDENGVWCPILHLDMNADGSNFSLDAMEDVLAVTELESYYLVEDCFAEAPCELNLMLIYYVNGEMAATVEKGHDAAFYTRTLFDGTVDTFSS